MVSRVRVAAAACLLASGLFVGGAGGALAFADPEDAGGTGGAATPGANASEVPAGEAGAAPATVGVTGRPDRRGRHGQPPRVIVGNGREDAPSGSGESAQSGDSSKQSNGSGGHATGSPSAPVGEQPKNANPPVSAPVQATAAADPDPALAAAAPPDAGDPGAENPQGPEDPEDPDECDQDGHHCLPWWWPKPGLSSSGNGNGGVGSGATKPPTRRPTRPPVMQLPAPAQAPNGDVPVLPAIPDIVNPAPGLVSAAGIVELPAVSLPQIVVPPAAGGGMGAAAGPPPAAPRAPSAPRSPAEPPRSPVQAVDNPIVPASYRVGYGEYLRTAGISQVVAVAVPGATGIMLLTGAGGIIGYRQARSALASRSSRSARFTS